jgi:hypothetical protein
MATKAQALRVFAKTGTTLTSERFKGGVEFTIAAPEGFVFVDNNEPTWSAGVYLYNERNFMWDAFIEVCNEGITAKVGA